jgi:hypothetical protein
MPRPETELSGPWSKARSITRATVKVVASTSRTRPTCPVETNCVTNTFLPSPVAATPRGLGPTASVASTTPSVRRRTSSPLPCRVT